MSADEKIKSLSLLVAELAEIVRDAKYQTYSGEVVRILPSYQKDLTELAEEATNIGTVL